MNNKDEQESSQNVPTFKPDLRMVYYWETYANPYIKPNVTATILGAIKRMREDGLDEAIIPNKEAYKKAYYKWKKKEGYEKWRKENWERLMGGTEPYFDKVGMIKAAKDYRYWEGMQTKYHKFKKAVDFTTDGEKIQGNSEIITLIDELKAIRERVGEEGSERELQE